MSNLSPECRLVFLTAGPAPDPGVVATLAGEVDTWARVVLLAETERATTSLWRLLAPVPSDVVPAHVREYMQRSSLVTDFRMSYLGDLLNATLGQLSADGVGVVLLKGAALGRSVYASFGERPMLDVDLLIRPADVKAAAQAVLAAGWKEAGDPVVERLLAGHHHLPPFIDAKNTGLRLELHTRLMPAANPFAVSDDDVWASARRLPGDAHGALVPDAHHLLWHACLHFAWSHTMRFGAWRTFRDVTELVTHDLVDWDTFVKLATRSRGGSACYWTLRLAQVMSGVIVPPNVLEAIEPRGPRALKAAIERHFIADIAIGEGPRCPSTTLSHYLWRTAILPGLAGRKGADRFSTASRWEEELHGVRPDPVTGRVVRHLTGVKDWWRFVTRTLLAS